MEAGLDEKHDRWLRPEEIYDVLRNPNGVTISEEPPIKPQSGSIFHFDKKFQKHFRNDRYKWKKAKDGRTKEGHEKLKVGGVDALHCYYAHREDDEKFQRRSYWMIDKNFSHRVLVHYLDVNVVAYNHRASYELPPIQHEIASTSNQSNFQHSQAIDATNLNSAQTLELETTVSDNWFENVLPEHSFADEFWGIPLETSFDNYVTAGFSPCTNLRASSSGAVEPSHSSLRKRQWEGDDLFLDSTESEAIEGVAEEENQAQKRLKVTYGQKSQPPVPQPTATIGIATSAATNMTPAPESSNPALLQSRPTSDANQDFVQDVENQELEPTSIEPENGKSKAVVQNDFGTGKSPEFSEVAVMGSRKSLHELLYRASEPNTLASSSISTPTTDSQAIATIRTTLEMDFITMAGDVQRTDKISRIKSFVDSNCVPPGSRTMILPILKQLEQPLLAYSEYDKGKNLNDQVEARIKHLQPKVQFCDSKKRELQELEKLKMQIEANQAAIRAEIDGVIKETEPIQAELKELLPQRDQFKENEGNLKTSLDIGDGLWTTLKKVVLRYLLT